MISYLIPALRNVTSFSFFGSKKGDNAFMTFKAGNQIIDKINNQFPYISDTFFLTQIGIGGAAPTFNSFQPSADALSCRAGTCLCTKLADPFCSSACCKSAVYDAVGVYSIIIPEAGPLQIGALIQPVTNPTHQIIYNRLANVGNDAVIQISTYVSGVLTDNILNNTFVELKFGSFTPY